MCNKSSLILVHILGATSSKKAASLLLTYSSVRVADSEYQRVMDAAKVRQPELMSILQWA